MPDVTRGRLRLEPRSVHTWASWVALVIKNPPANAEDVRQVFEPWVRKIPWRRAWPPIPVFLPGESHGQRSLAGYSPWSCKVWDTTEATEHAVHTSVLFPATALPSLGCG